MLTEKKVPVLGKTMDKRVLCLQIHGGFFALSLAMFKCEITSKSKDYFNL